MNKLVKQYKRLKRTHEYSIEFDMLPLGSVDPQVHQPDILAGASPMELIIIGQRPELQICNEFEMPIFMDFKPRDTPKLRRLRNSDISIRQPGMYRFVTRSDLSKDDPTLHYHLDVYQKPKALKLPHIESLQLPFPKAGANVTEIELSKLMNIGLSDDHQSSFERELMWDGDVIFQVFGAN